MDPSHREAAYEAHRLIRASEKPEGRTYKMLSTKHANNKLVQAIARHLPALIATHCYAVAYDKAVEAALKDIKE